MPVYKYREKADGERRTARSILHEKTLVEWLVCKFNRVPAWTRAAIWGWIVFLVTSALDAAFFQFLFGLTRMHLQAILFADFSSAVLIGWIMFIVLHKREEILTKRFREIGYLNHHVRNALMVIENAEYVVKEQQRKSMVLEETARIRKCVERISRIDDVEISEEYSRVA